MPIYRILQNAYLGRKAKAGGLQSIRGFEAVDIVQNTPSRPARLIQNSDFEIKAFFQYQLAAHENEPRLAVPSCHGRR